MTSHSAVLARILSRKLIAVIRLADRTHAVDIISAIVEGGIPIVEITLTTPGAIDLIGQLSGRNDLIVGAGTVLGPDEARAAFEAGATFFASPIFDREVMAVAQQFDRVSMPGAYTPTEIVHAHRAGADLVKIFPMPNEGARMIRTLRGPLPKIPIAPSGGVDANNARHFLEAGAAALNIGSWLTHDADGTIAPVELIRQRAEELVGVVEEFERTGE